MEDGLAALEEASPLLRVVGEGFFADRIQQVDPRHARLVDRVDRGHHVGLSLLDPHHPAGGPQPLLDGLPGAHVCCEQPVAQEEASAPEEPGEAEVPVRSPSLTQALDRCRDTFHSVSRWEGRLGNTQAPKRKTCSVLIQCATAARE